MSDQPKAPDYPHDTLALLMSEGEIIGWIAAAEGVHTTAQQALGPEAKVGDVLIGLYDDARIKPGDRVVVFPIRG